VTGQRDVADPLMAGWGALGEGDWEGARAYFETAVAHQESAEALEGLSWAAYYLDDESLTFDSRERAYTLYRQSEDDGSAARMAAWLATDSLDFRGQPAVANGWLARAHRLLDDLEPGADHGWLAVHEASIVLEDNPTDARRLAAGAVELGRGLGMPELEMLGLGIEGAALVRHGALDEGMRRLDEATTAALAGEARNLVCAGWACCYMISACEQVRDYGRARQWCERVGAFCERHGISSLLGVCRAHYAGVLMWQGRWSEAEAEATLAADRLGQSRPALACEAILRLAELRRRQGRLTEAEALYGQCEGAADALLGRAALALDRNLPDEAVELAERYLRRFPTSEGLKRWPGQEIAVQAHLRAGNREAAAGALNELRALAAQMSTPQVRAAALISDGTFAAACGRHAVARRAFEDALDLLVAEGAPFEEAGARLHLAGSLAALGRGRAARRAADAALATFEELGATGEAARARSFLRRLPGPHPPQPVDGDQGPLADLSPRQLEVLTLLAEGLTNQQIAERLVLSEHTVHRHVANILQRLGTPSRAAAASLAGRHGLP
jgi:LuxR family transcriptional regulator, maltose regulon positive regulatory protein